MKLLVTIFITLILAVSIGLFALENPGYVLIAAGKWTLESTLAFAVVVLLVGFAASYYLIRIVSRMRRVPGGLRYWRQRRRERKAMVFLTRGLIDLAEGHWEAAEKRVTRYVKEGHAPLLNYLAAARAAQGQGADQRRDHYLKLAHESHKDADIAVGLTQAELQLQHNQLEQALATLTHLQQLAPKHPQVLKALAGLYQQLGDWERLLELMPRISRKKLFSSEEIERINRKAYLSVLNTFVSNNKQQKDNIETLNSIWSRIPKPFQSDKQILLAYVNRMMEFGGGNQIEPLLRYALKHHWDEQLIKLYGLVAGTDPVKQLGVAESFLAGHERDAVALLTAGRLSLRNKLWGKARSYLEASVHTNPSAEAYNELGNLLEQLGEKNLASDCYRKGLRLAPGCEHTVPIHIEKTIASSDEQVTHEHEPKELASSESEALNVPAELQSRKVKVIT